MSAVVNTYLQFEARESLVRHISVAYVAAKAEGETNTFLCMAYIHWLRAFPEDALDGLVALPKHHGHRAPEPVVPEGSPTFLDVVEATLIYHRLFAYTSIQHQFRNVCEPALLNQEQQLINAIEDALELFLKVAGPCIRTIEHDDWCSELYYASRCWMIYNRLPTSMLSGPDALLLPPPYTCYSRDPPAAALSLMWTFPTTTLDHIEGHEDEEFEQLRLDWENELQSLHSSYLGSDRLSSDFGIEIHSDDDHTHDSLDALKHSEHQEGSRDIQIDSEDDGTDDGSENDEMEMDSEGDDYMPVDEDDSDLEDHDFEGDEVDVLHTWWINS